MAKHKELSYSQASNELAKIVAEIEAEEVDLDILADKIMRASFLIRYCKEKLRLTEDEVKKALTDTEAPAEDRNAF